MGGLISWPSDQIRSCHSVGCGKGCQFKEDGIPAGVNGENTLSSTVKWTFPSGFLWSVSTPILGSIPSIADAHSHTCMVRLGSDKIDAVDGLHLLL